LVAIFLFKARDRQQIASFWAQISAAIALIVVIGMLLLYGASGTGIRSMVAEAENVVAVAAPLVGLVLFRSARSAIARDIKLIKSMDRLRD
jgi:metal-dependent hydrolase (beta-lactamase superfamily II)